MGQVRPKSTGLFPRREGGAEIFCCLRTVDCTGPASRVGLSSKTLDETVRSLIAPNCASMNLSDHLPRPPIQPLLGAVTFFRYRSIVECCLLTRRARARPWLPLWLWRAGSLCADAKKTSG